MASIFFKVDDKFVPIFRLMWIADVPHFCGEEDCVAEFHWVLQNEKSGVPVRFEIPSMGGWLGAYDQRLWKRENRLRRNYVWRIRCTGVEPGFVKRQRLEYYTTHTHQSGRDLPYRYGYLFRFCLPIPPDAKALKLPQDNRIKIMSATVANNPVTAALIRKLTDKYDF